MARGNKFKVKLDNDDDDDGDYDAGVEQNEIPALRTDSDSVPTWNFF